MIGLHAYRPAFPEITLSWPFPAFRGTQEFILRLSFPMIGFFFLVNTETLFSLWFFNRLAWTARGYMTLLGIEAGLFQLLIRADVAPVARIAITTACGVVTFALVCVWTEREGLLELGRIAAKGLPIPRRLIPAVLQSA